MKTFKEVRWALNSNIDLEKRATLIRDKADALVNKMYLDEYIELDEESKIIERKIGVCDYLREQYPGRWHLKSDEEIIEHYNMLEDKYEKEQNDS